MIPARLTLRNFLCYRDNCPMIDFTGIQVACLTGENGNGKSALLDAITWALWGQARAKTDDELIHLGRTEMEVEFEFYAGEQCYRVIRKRKRGTQRSPGSTALEFHLATPDGWKPLTANHVRDTERRVRDVLGLDYETFINSALLLQGRADAFTTKTPGERKRILGEILGLSRYDDLEQQARYERGLRDDQARSLERDLAEIEAALALEPGYAEERDRLAGSLTKIESDFEHVSQQLEALRQAAQLAALQREQLEQAERRRSEAEAEVARAQEQIEHRRTEVARHEAITREAGAIRDGYERLREALASDESLNARLRQRTDVERKRAEAEAELERARSGLSAKERLLAAEVERLEALTAAAETMAATRLQLEQRAARLAADEVRLHTLREEVQSHREAVIALRTENTGLRAEMDTIKRRQNELATATVCPLCRTELGEDGQKHILAAYETDGRRLAADFRAKREQIETRERRLAEIEAQLVALESETNRNRVTLARESERAEAALKDAAEAAAQLPGRRAALEALRSRLTLGEFAPELARRLKDLTLELAALHYDGGEHERIRRVIQELRPFESRHRELELAATLLESDRALLFEAERSLVDWRTRLEQSMIEIGQMRSGLAAQPDVARQLEETNAKYEALRQQQRRHQQALGAIEQKLDDCDRLRRQQAAKSADLKKALEERRIYEELTAAFSRRGIQALIIDQVLPEITEEANRLLSRMTNSRLQVMIDTQRQTQKGAVAETLDIRISDELGTRNYEMFSGGEAFRVNLALRIALSKLLARRAGAPLPTLVIDEGFGSQDSAALERLIEAINVIQSDFRCLLIITHLAELKDQFPVQIAVTKTPEGSFATVTS